MKKDVIMCAAFKLFANNGYEGTSMQQIADTTGVQKASLYAHFKSKLEIYTAVIESQVRLFKENVFDGLKDFGDKEPRDDLKRLFIHTACFFSRKESILFWKQLFIQAAAAEGGESYAVTRKAKEAIANEMLTTLDVIFKYNEKNGTKPQEQAEKYLIVMHGFLDMMLFNTGDENDVIKAASEKWDVFAKNFFPAD